MAMRERKFAADDDEGARAGVQDVPADEGFDGFGSRPCRASALDAPDDPAKVFECGGAAVQISV